MKQKIVKYISIPIVLIVIIMMVVSMFTSSLIMILSGGEEEEESNQTIEYDASPISGAVEALRDDILKELKKYNKEQYIDLVLALVMQESGGEGEDVFQCSESLGKKPNSIGKKQSIEHGVKVLCNLMNDKRIKVASPNDLEKIKIVLQAYNYGGGYVDYINETNFGRSVTTLENGHRIMPFLIRRKKVQSQITDIRLHVQVLRPQYLARTPTVMPITLSTC